MGKISKQKLAMKDSIRSYGGIFFHFLSEILTRHNKKETVIKGKIWGPFYIPKGEGLGGGYIIRKYYVIKKVYINPNPKFYSGMYNNGDAKLLQYIFI